MADVKIKQPEWTRPQKTVEEPVLKIYNSMTRTKTEFVPMNGRLVKWYNCGPTVYDAAHIGHARNYVTQDIIRRILVDYFGYDVHFVMNITDIDDKIIIRSRQTHLISNLRSESPALTQFLISQTRSAWNFYLRTMLKKALPEEDRRDEGREEWVWTNLVRKNGEDQAWRKGCKERDEKFDMHVTSLTVSRAAIDAASKALESGDSSKSQADLLITSSIDVLGPWLDDKFGATITDPSISRALSTYWEISFMSDLSRLHVLPPDTLTRVTEYVPEIVDFVEKIVKNGFGYEADGSVYFDTMAFEGAKGKGTEEWKHTYAKLQPWSKDNEGLREDGEGSLSKKSSNVHSKSDFALWKRSSPGEPSWPSPWGQGRPGWHIECSVMASDVLGENMDIHSGGIDLAFPHHDNEMAQSEAYHDCRQWVNYFIHTGHLHIEGLKMSKSLKNFITIEDALRKYSARQLRLAFLSQLWSAKMDFRESAIAEVKAMEIAFDNFFTTTKALVAEAKAAGVVPQNQHQYRDAEKELTAYLYQTQNSFRQALCDSFNTPDALSRLIDLVSKTNVYLSRGRANVNVSVVENVAKWVSRMLRMFGLGEGPTWDGGIGWGDVQEEGGGGDRETILMPYLRALSTFRDSVRQLAIAKASSNEVLALCDKLRDADLVPLGVALDDQEDGKALVKLVRPELLIQAREEKSAQAAEKAAKKALQQNAEKAKRIARIQKGKISPLDMFKSPNVEQGVYGSWDEKGLPLTDAEGVELTKSRAKKLQKEWEQQKKAHDEWLVWSKTEEGKEAEGTPGDARS